MNSQSILELIIIENNRKGAEIKGKKNQKAAAVVVVAVVLAQVLLQVDHFQSKPVKIKVWCNIVYLDQKAIRNLEIMKSLTTNQNGTIEI